MSHSENRYLLILTENYAALPIMQQHLLGTADDAVVIFGSSFPNDQEYTQVKRKGGKTLYILRELLYSSQLQNQHIAVHRVTLITVWVGFRHFAIILSCL